MAEPKYVVLRDRIEADVLTGLDPRSPLPPERTLMATYGVSRATVRRALDLLSAEGLVDRIQGAGTFVADPASVSKTMTLTSFTEDIEARGMVPGSRFTRLDRLPADADIAQDLGLSPGAPVVHVHRVRTADGAPMCLEDVWVPADLLPNAPGELTSLYSLLADLGAAPERADQTIRATVVDADQGARLGIAPHSPAFLVTRLTRDATGRPVERGRSLYRADRYDFRFTVQRRRRT